MRTLQLWLTVMVFLCIGGTYAQTPVDYVNMRIGTDGKSRTEYGGTTPAVSTPFGMTQWSAVTRRNGISRTMYHNRDTTLIGFMATHQPAIWMGDYGYMTLQPQCGNLKIQPEQRRVTLDHAKEIQTPYYYRVETDGEPGGAYTPITTEFTATSRASFFRIAYPDGERPLLYLEAGRGGKGGGIKIYPEKKEIHIFNQERNDAHLGPETPHLRGYYVLRFSEAFADFGCWKDATTLPGQESVEGGKCGGYVSFAENVGTVEVRIGSSFIDFDQARENLTREMPNGKSFKQITASVKKSWNNYLSQIKLKGASEDDRTVFYTAFFHTLQYPREFSEYGRYYSAFDDKIHEGVSYNAYSLWDTFRAEHPWIQLMAPERVNDMVTALVQMWEEGGWLPKWPNPTYTSIMIGSHADVVIADAYVNGFRGYDLEKAYQAVRKDAYVPPLYDEKRRWGDRDKWSGQYEARGGLTNYLKLGYVASDATNESVARTLEFALDDYCIAQMAKGLGHMDDYTDLMNRSANYKNLFYPKTRFFNARKKDGSWDNPKTGFTEGANWTYRFCVMQDVPELIRLMGGNEAFTKELDLNFDEKHYRHDNEPGHHYAYLYNYCGRWDKTRQRIADIRKQHYKNLPDGLSGNDDCGQMSAWYLFSSLGFYPVTPTSGIYALGVPRFEEVTLKVPGGKKLTVKVHVLKSGETEARCSLNGQSLIEPFIRITDLWKGGKLEFFLPENELQTVLH